ncbi:DgyrCDS13994 [Dimorphilus gyrociliatus]|uniref:DgyrCDS13994 n=1 Tax=Dimorphilus gyrociliatus TaxID=2664684 RepID=A0A7I8WC86_9ANNE|nr:DgyrCDS13994 [Dimorphilus gyrociliatus]
MGGLEAGNALSIYISKFLKMLESKDIDHNIKIEIIRMLSTSVCDNKTVHESLMNNNAISLFIDIVKEGDKLARWICYTILLMTRDNDDLLVSLPDFPDFFQTISYAESLSWEGWQYNIARVLLQIAGLQKPNFDLLRSIETDYGYYDETLDKRADGRRRRRHKYRNTDAKPKIDND